MVDIYSRDWKWFNNYQKDDYYNTIIRENKTFILFLNIWYDGLRNMAKKFKLEISDLRSDLRVNTYNKLSCK